MTFSKTAVCGAATALALAAGVISHAPASAQQAAPNRGLQEIPADKAKVTGTIVIDFNSRVERSTSGVDVYDVQNLAISDLMVYNGTIQRTPTKQLTYSLRIDLFNPNNPSQIARDAAIIRGDLIIDDRGRYLPEPGNLRLDIVKGQQITNKFRGSIQGREVTRWWEIGERLRKAQKDVDKLYSRYVDGRTVTIQVKNPDPLGFNVVLATGPFSYLPETRVTGNLDYDYELGNWLTDNNGITFTYQLADKAHADKFTGSIRYVEEKGTFNDSAGKSRDYTGYYDYSLRVNEQTVEADKAFFDGKAEQAELDAFFSSADQSKPGLYGRVYYNDSEANCKKAKGEDGKLACVGPTRSEVTYDLKPVKMTYQQLAAWFKLEPLIIGPLTDE